MAGELEKFTLPREDWYDSEGRIYKDALIENFNAIEEKLLQIARLDALNIEPPDISSVEYPDVTFDSDDNSIINLRSFLTMTNLVGYPIEFTFSDTYTVDLSFWNANYDYVTLSGVDIEASKSKPYIYLNYAENTVFSSNSTTTPENCKMIGCYTDGVIKCVTSKDYIPINVLFYLAKMKNDMYNYKFNRLSRDSYSAEKGIAKNNRVIGAADTNKKTPWSNTVVFRDTGRTSE